MKLRCQYGRGNEKMNKIFSHNLSWKIGSLVLAAILWLFVINSQNPTQPQEIRNIPIVIKGLPELESKGFVLKNKDKIQDQKFKAVIRGPRLQVDKVLANKSLIKATLDLTPYINELTVDSIINVAEYTVTVSLEGISVISTAPEVTNVILEKEKTVEKKITYRKIGEPKNGYMELEPIITPNTVTLSGAQSDIDSIREVSVEINIDKFSQDYLIDRIPVKVYDEEGEEIQNIKKSIQLVDVKLPIGKTKTVPLEATFTGTLPADYVHTNTLISPKEITIVGKEELVDQVEKIQLKPISLDNLIQTSIIKTEIILPKGIEYIDTIDKQVDVTLEIKKENTYPFDVVINGMQIEVVGMNEDLGYEILTPRVSIILKATAEELVTFDTLSITGKLDLTGLHEGDYNLPIELSIPENFVIMNKPINVDVRLTRIIPESPSPEEGQQAMVESLIEE